MGSFGSLSARCNRAVPHLDTANPKLGFRLGRAGTRAFTGNHRVGLASQVLRFTAHLQGSDRGLVQWLAGGPSWPPAPRPRLCTGAGVRYRSAPCSEQDAGGNCGRLDPQDAVSERHLVARPSASSRGDQPPSGPTSTSGVASETGSPPGSARATLGTARSERRRRRGLAGADLGQEGPAGLHRRLPDDPAQPLVPLRGAGSGPGARPSGRRRAASGGPLRARPAWRRPTRSGLPLAQREADLERRRRALQTLDAVRRSRARSDRRRSPRARAARSCRRAAARPRAGEVRTSSRRRLRRRRRPAHRASGAGRRRGGGRRRRRARASRDPRRRRAPRRVPELRRPGRRRSRSAEGGAEPGEEARLRRLDLLAAQLGELAKQLVLLLRQLDGRVDEDADEQVAAAPAAKARARRGRRP